ncbi:MAG: STAS domain-containing protein [Chloroflexi bacterium]|nr:STAS domain-containing protein [Chloroflexota bacterium]
MQISISKRGSVTVMHIQGDVDSSTYLNVIDKAQQAYDDGARNLLLDLSKVPYVSSAGLMALHTVARIFMGQPVNTKEGGRPTFRAIHPQQDASIRNYVKLLSPQPAVMQVLDVVGLSQFLEIFSDLEIALDSFTAPAA